jgi:hypothetical protein
VLPECHLPNCQFEECEAERPGCPQKYEKRIAELEARLAQRTDLAAHNFGRMNACATQLAEARRLLGRSLLHLNSREAEHIKRQIHAFLSADSEALAGYNAATADSGGDEGR